MNVQKGLCPQSDKYFFIGFSLSGSIRQSSNSDGPTVLVISKCSVVNLAL